MEINMMVTAEGNPLGAGVRVLHLKTSVPAEVLERIEEGKRDQAKAIMTMPDVYRAVAGFDAEGRLFLGLGPDVVTADHELDVRRKAAMFHTLIGGLLLGLAPGDKPEAKVDDKTDDNPLKRILDMLERQKQDDGDWWKNGGPPPGSN
jgi:hypothetical protein